MGLVIDPKTRNLQEIIGFLTKIQLYLDLCALIWYGNVLFDIIE